MYTLKDVVGGIEHHELVKLKKDLNNGGLQLKKLLDFQIKENERMHGKLCSTCQNEVDPYSTSTYTLVFGPDDFKKKATFCAMDCLEFFLERLKGIKVENSR